MFAGCCSRVRAARSFVGMEEDSWRGLVVDILLFNLLRHFLVYFGICGDK